MPVGAFGGRADIMEQLSPQGPVYQAGTLSGNPVAMTAGLATLGKLSDGSLHADLEAKNRRFVAKLTSRLNGSAVNIAGVASIFWIVFQLDLPRKASDISADGISHYNRMHDSILEAGLYLPPSGYEVCFISAAHTDDMLDNAANTLGSAIAREAHVWA